MRAGLPARLDYVPCSSQNLTLCGRVGTDTAIASSALLWTLAGLAPVKMTGVVHTCTMTLKEMLQSSQAHNKEENGQQSEYSCFLVKNAPAGSATLRPYWRVIQAAGDSGSS